MLPIFMVLAPACIVHITQGSRLIDVGTDIDAVSIRIDAGEVRLIADGNENGAHGTAILEWSGADPDLLVDTQGSTLVIVGECRNLLVHCSIDLELALPPGVDVAVETGAGDIVTQGILGMVDLDSGAGDLLVSGAGSLVYGHTGAGDIVGTGLRAAVVEVDTGAGRIDLTHVELFDHVTAETGAGDIDLLVPTGTYRVLADTGVGQVTISGIDQDDHAGATIDASTGAGDIRVTGYTPGAGD